MKNISKYILIAIPSLLLIAVLVFFLLKLPTQEKQRKYGDLIVQGNSQLEQKEYAKALSTYNDAALIINSKYEAYEGIAKILVAKNQLGQLNDLVSKSSTILSGESLSKLYGYLGDGYLKVGNYELASDNYKKSLSSMGNNELSKIGLAQSYLSLGNYEKAKETLDLSTESVNYEKAYILTLISKYSNIEDIKSALALNFVPKEDLNKKIVADFTTISKVDSTDDLYIAALLGRIYVNNGYSALAVTLLEPLKDKLMEYGDGVYVLASAYYNLSDYTKAITILKDYSNPNADPDIYLLYARSNVGIDEIDDAIKAYDSAVVASGDKSEAIYVEYVKYLLDQAQYAKSKEVLDRADKKYNENWLDTYYLRMYVEQKNNAKAQFYLDKLAKATNTTDTEKKEYLYWAISQYIESSKSNDAIILLAKLKELDKYNAQYYYLAGKLHLQTANTSEAKSELEQAIDYDLNGLVTENAKKLLSRVN